MAGEHRSGGDRPRYCAECGGELAAERDATNGWPCLRCKSRTWLDPKVAACACVFWQDKLVMVRRAIEPRYGFWVLPGGYCERGERPAAAAERETREEVGLDVRAGELVGVYAYDGSPVVVIVYEAELLGGGPPRALDEVLEVGLFTEETVPWEDLACPSNRDGLRDLFARRRAAAGGAR